jgi:hypothetical protein
MVSCRVNSCPARSASPELGKGEPAIRSDVLDRLTQAAGVTASLVPHDDQLRQCTAIPVEILA